MEIILSNHVKSLTGSLGRGLGYHIKRRKHGFFGERNSNGFVPKIGHWSFIVVCAELADMRLHIEDVKVKRREIAEALWEADKRVESGLVLINEQNYPDILNAQQVLKLKKDLSL